MLAIIQMSLSLIMPILIDWNIIQITRMDIQSSSSKKSIKYQSNSSNHSKQHSRNLIALIGQNINYTPYKSKFEMNSIASGKSRESRDSDLLNRLAKESSKASSKSLNRQISANNLDAVVNNKQMGSSNSNSGASEKSSGQLQKKYHKIQAHMMLPKIHNCVCFVAGQCLSYNCNCFLSPFPCTPECCPNCLDLKLNLPHKITNRCSCKKTKCLKLYCQCLSKGVYCSVMCRCQLCENHQNNTNLKKELSVSISRKGCSCKKNNCMKKYCQCNAANLKCTPKCGCFDCHNMIQLQCSHKIKEQDKIVQKMEVEEEEDEMKFEEIDFFGTRRR